MNTKFINPTEIIDQNPMGKRQLLIIAICALLMILDGYDVQAISYVAPSILQEWQIEKSALSPIFGAGLFGLLLGSLIFSILADKIGRRPVLITTTLFFAICMLATPFASTVEQLAWIRFITGLGLGAIMPNSMALCGEISPKHKRIFIMMLISGGFTAGALLGGLIAAAIIPIWGWKSVFISGGILPLFLGIIMLFVLPESLQLLNSKGKQDKKIKNILSSFFPKMTFNTTDVIEPAKSKEAKIPIIALFHQNRTFFTLSIWVISILNMIGLYFLASWLPTLAKTSGLDLQQALLLGSTLQLGGLLGTILMGKWIDKAGFYKILFPCFIVAGVAITTIGFSVNLTSLLFASVFIAGFTIVGGQPAINALSADYYPTELRTTGVGWSLGIGRIGSVIGPVLGGQFIAMNLEMNQLFIFVAIPSALVLLMLIWQKHTLTKIRKKYPSNIQQEAF